IILIFTIFFNPLAINAKSLDFELALIDGVIDFDNGKNEFIFGTRILWLISRYSFEFDLSYIPRINNDMIFYNFNILIEISKFTGTNSYPQLIPFAIAGIGRTYYLGENGWNELSYNVGAGVRIYTSNYFGVRADFREHFYWHESNLKLNIEVSGGIVFKF
ncbi:hypothetical protein NLC29_04170, partial [Candidatus Aminicenantes bacterium AH-873-B07]|nr:hypothetical protein [Candidatus Aminicenantes bacterium AH-873-B07]